MVAVMNNDFFAESKGFFQDGDIVKTIEHFGKAISTINPEEKEKQAEYVSFLKRVLERCRNEGLLEEEAKILRMLGRIHSLYGQHYESLNYHRESLKIQRKLGRKSDLADGLVLLADSLEINGKHEECMDALKTAIEIFHELGKLKREKEIRKQVSHLKEFSKQMVEDEYYVRKFNIRRE